MPRKPNGGQPVCTAFLFRDENNQRWRLSGVRAAHVTAAALIWTVSLLDHDADVRLNTRGPTCTGCVGHQMAPPSPLQPMLLVAASTTLPASVPALRPVLLLPPARPSNALRCCCGCCLERRQPCTQAGIADGRPRARPPDVAHDMQSVHAGVGRGGIGTVALQPLAEREST